jgi:hypothetical protein
LPLERAGRERVGEGERGRVGEGKTKVIVMSFSPSPPRLVAPSFSLEGEGDLEMKL